MARCLLVSYAGLPVMPSSFFPDNGLASLAGALLAAGHSVKVIDLNTVSSLGRLVEPETTGALRALLPALARVPDTAEVSRLAELSSEIDLAMTRVAGELAADVIEEAGDFGAGLVGFKLWSGDGLLASVRMAEALREALPSVRIHAGGPAVLYSGETIFELTRAFDSLVEGEGEQAIVGLAAHADGLVELSEVPSLILPARCGAKRTRPAEGLPLDLLAPSVYTPEVYPSARGDEQIRLFVVDEARGCGHGCAFCIHPAATGPRTRAKSARAIASELRALRDRHGATAVRFAGSSMPSQTLRALPDALRAEGLSMRFCGFAHPHGVGPAEARALAKAGCRSLFFGIESFHPPDLRLLGKNLDLRRARATVRAAADAGIHPILSLIVPCPGQTDEGRRANFEAAMKLCAGGRATVATQVPALLPRTPWFARPEAYGFELLASRDDYRRLLATYKIRHIVPPELWPPVPYRLDGMGFAELAAVNAELQRALTREGVVVNLPDESLLLADVLGEDLGAMHRQLQELFFTLDVARIRSFVERANAAVGAA